MVEKLVDSDSVLIQVEFTYRSGRRLVYTGEALDEWERQISAALSTVEMLRSMQVKPAEKDESLKEAIFGE